MTCLLYCFICVCVCVYMCMCLCTCVRACESPKLMPGVFLDHFQAYSLRQEFAVEPELVDKASQAKKVALENLFSAFQALGLQVGCHAHPEFCMGCKDQNSSPYACCLHGWYFWHLSSFMTSDLSSFIHLLLRCDDLIISHVGSCFSQESAFESNNQVLWYWFMYTKQILERTN